LLMRPLPARRKAASPEPIMFLPKQPKIVRSYRLLLPCHRPISQCLIHRQASRQRTVCLWHQRQVPHNRRGTIRTGMRLGETCSQHPNRPRTAIGNKPASSSHGSPKPRSSTCKASFRTDPSRRDQRAEADGVELTAAAWMTTFPIDVTLIMVDCSALPCSRSYCLRSSGLPR
jgi:hypothetical protein